MVEQAKGLAPVRFLCVFLFFMCPCVCVLAHTVELVCLSAGIPLMVGNGAIFLLLNYEPIIKLLCVSCHRKPRLKHLLVSTPVVTCDTNIQTSGCL